MSNFSTGVLSSNIIVAAVLAAASSGSGRFSDYKDTELPQSSFEIMKTQKTGLPILFYPHALYEFSGANNESSSVDISSIKMQLRFKNIMHSFFRNCNNVMSNKLDYVLKIANAVCKLPFYDNLSTYNELDNSLDSVLSMSNGLTLSISQFLDEEIDSPVVFSLHRRQTLLVSDELPIDEIVQSIISVIEKYGNGGTN